MEKGDHLEVSLSSGDNSNPGQDFNLTCNGVSTHTNLPASARDGGHFSVGTCDGTANGDYPVVATF